MTEDRTPTEVRPDLIDRHDAVSYIESMTWGRVFPAEPAPSTRDLVVFEAALGAAKRRLALIDAAPAAEPVPLTLSDEAVKRIAWAMPWYDEIDPDLSELRAAVEQEYRGAEPVPLTLDALTLIPFVERPMTAAYFEDLKAGVLSSEQVARAIAGDLAALASPDKGEPR